MLKELKRDILNSNFFPDSAGILFAILFLIYLSGQLQDCNYCEVTRITSVNKIS